VVAGSIALAATTLSATAAVPATALTASSSAQVSTCEDGHSGAAATARVRKGAEQVEPKMFKGTGEEYLKLDDAATLAAGGMSDAWNQYRAR
jgi:hypothetical protein